MRLSTAAAYVAAAAEGKAQDKPLHSSAPRFDDGRAPEHENQQQNPSHGQTFRMSRLRVEFMRVSCTCCESRKGDSNYEIRFWEQISYVKEQFESKTVDDTT